MLVRAVLFYGVVLVAVFTVVSALSSRVPASLSDSWWWVFVVVGGGFLVGDVARRVYGRWVRRPPVGPA